jgi:hypothetical protein
MKLGSKKGLTLIEVLLAAAFLGLAVTTILTAISRCLQVYKSAAMYHKELWALSAGESEHPLIVTMRPKDFDPEDYEVSAEDYDGVTYERTVEDPFEGDDDSDVRLLVVKTKLNWTGRHGERSDEIMRLILYREK